ncbi:hypothetical protein AB5J52_48710 (plasmid) [Streptomyces sp. R39]|uniref:YcaO domain-containing protein n=1 Tax=Streptomyces sp. R39 TaxID=3238631 RepID=A0AB39R5L7_9ACTN
MSSISAIAAVVPCVNAAAGTAAVVAPYDGDGPYPQAFTRHAWRTMAVLPEPRRRPLAYQAVAAPAGYTETIVHRQLRQTVKALRAMGVSVVVAGSATGIELAERIAWHLGLPGADPASSPLRYDRGVQADILAHAGIPAVRGIRTTSLAEAVAWTQALPLPGYLLGPSVTGSPIEPMACTTELQISAAWPAMRRAAAGYTGSAYLVLTEQHSPRQYTLNSATRPGPDGRPEHTITDIWAESFTSAGQWDRADLLMRDGLLTRTLSQHARRALDVLGVQCGPASTRLAYGVDDGAGDGPLVVSVLAAPVVTPADDALLAATGRDRIADVLDAWIPSRAGLGPAPGGQHVVRVRLSHCAAIASWPERIRVLRALPTVVALSEHHIPSTSLGAEVVLSSTNPRAIEEDYRTVRALDQQDLNGPDQP